MDNCKVLIVEDEALVAHDISTTLQHFGFSVVDTVDTAEASIDAVRSTKPDIIIMDIILKGNTDGIEAAEKIRKEHDIPIIFLSTFSEDDIVKRATTQLPYGYVLKPFRSIELGILIEVTRNRHRIERHLQEKNQMLIRNLKKSMEKESHLQELSLIDELTGIYNRRGFRLLAQQQIEIAKRTGRGLMVCFFDLDHMKNINDVYGHGAGDAIIRAAVGVLKKTFRSSDILSRWGGDEFVVMMINADEEDMPSIEERILSHIHGFNDTADHRYVLSLSWGTCRYDPSGADTLDELITRSDAEMYRSKTRKRS